MWGNIEGVGQPTGELNT